jgi:hypothetical protein
MAYDPGPIESALASPGFNLFWNRLMSDLGELHDKLADEAEESIKNGEVSKSNASLLRAAQTRDIISRIKDAPTKARNREKEKHYGRPDESRSAGYSDAI